MEMSIPDPTSGVSKAGGEAEARYSQAEFEAIFANAIEAIVCIDIRGTITRANPAVRTIFGYPPEALLGRNVKCLMPSPDRERHDRYIQHYLDSGERRIIGIGREVTGLRRDGSEVPLDLSILEIKVDGVHSFTGVMRDISERKRSEALLREREQEIIETREQLAHLDRLRIANTLSTGIAHELTQPLTAIDLFAKSCRHLLDHRDCDTDQLRETLVRIENLAHRACDVINNLRDLTKAQPTGRRPTDINGLIENTLDLALIDSREQDIAIELELDPHLPPVHAAATQIQLVLMNLIRNARESLAGGAASRRQRIRVSSDRLPGGDVCVTVRDNGAGIGARDLEHIFEPFHSRKPAGIGMGLPISRGIIESHGGSLCANGDVTDGAEFYFTLPVDTGGNAPDGS